MLILTRRMGEKLIIGDDIMVSVLGRKGGQIRVGIEAPREVAVQCIERKFFGALKRTKRTGRSSKPPTQTKAPAPTTAKALSMDGRSQ